MVGFYFECILVNEKDNTELRPMALFIRVLIKQDAITLLNNKVEGICFQSIHENKKTMKMSQKRLGT